MRNILKFNISRKDLYIVFFLVLLVSLSQFILAKKNLEMGFFTDDWGFLSAYRLYVTNPFLDIMNAWKQIGSHNFSYSYYMGILYHFFGLDYSAYRITNLIFKIIATLTLYPLVLYISKRRSLAFLSTFIYAIHFSSFGLLDGPSRGGNFIAIALMNLFLLVYFYISEKKITNIFISFSLSVWLFTIILFGSTRLFPLIVIVPLIELVNIWGKVRKGLGAAIKRLLVVYFPFLPLFLFSPKSISDQVGYIIGLIDKLKEGNWQLFLTPFAVMGSMYIPKNFWPFFGQGIYNNLSSYLSSLLAEAMLLYFVLLIFIVFFISKKPLKFLARNLILNFVVGIFAYLIDHNWLFLDTTTRTPVDPGTFLVPALIGLFVTVTSFCVFLEWKESEKKNNLLPFLFIPSLFSLIFIFLTWLFADINSIFMGVHAYLTIPAIGTSIVVAGVLVLIYEKLSYFKSLGKIIRVFLIVIILFFYFEICAVGVDEFFSHWVNNGLRISDQRRIIDEFWAEIGDSRNFNQNNLPLVYLDADKTEYENGIFYSEAIVWKLASWFDLRYRKEKEGRFALCQIMILSREELDKYVSLTDDGKKIISTRCGENISYDINNFFAFKLQKRNLIPNRKEVLTKLGIE